MKHKPSLILAAALSFVALALPSHQTFAKARTVVCKDGATSPAGRGACSKHGGVDKAATAAKEKQEKQEKKAAKAEKTAKKEKATKKEKAAKTEAAARAEPKKSAPAERAGGAGPAGATARCKDGTYSHAKEHRGACSKHGGVAEWLKP